jgi:hypothetical protein
MPNNLGLRGCKWQEPEALGDLMDEWLAGLGDTDTARITVLDDLLKHAVTDNMSSEDTSVCLTALSSLVDRPVLSVCCTVAEPVEVLLCLKS